MNTGLNGKRALVTGSSSGLGAAMARALADEGVSVVVHGRRREAVETVRGELAAAGHSVAAAFGDLTDDALADSVAAQAHAAFGGIDILVNNAGAAVPVAGWFEGSPSHWIDLYDQNIASAVRMVQRLVPAMKQRRWGRVINLSSIVSDLANPFVPHYCATKAAMRNLTVSLARELVECGITVNSVSPGLIRTPATEPWMREWAQRNQWGDDWAGIERNIATHVEPNPLRRTGRPEEVAAVVVFLASEPAAFVNGSDVRVDGGANPTL